MRLEEHLSKNSDKVCKGDKLHLQIMGLKRNKIKVRSMIRAPIPFQEID
jgi:hypothetical protein